MKTETLEAHGIVPLKVIVRKGKEITYLAPEDHKTIIDLWVDNSITVPGLFISREPPGFVTSEGETGECYCEEWYCETHALRWLSVDCEDTGYLHYLDERCAEKRKIDKMYAEKREAGHPEVIA